MNTRKRDTFARHTETERASAKLIARNTWRYLRADGAEVIRLHNTDVAWRKDGQTTFDSGGFRTITTKDRMNKIGGYSVYSLKGRWHVKEGSGWRVRRGEKTIPFVDGITLPRDFGNRNVERTAAEEDALKDELNAFCKMLLDKKRPVPLPSSGDCFFCQFSATAAPQRGQPGDGTGAKDVHGPEHLRSHIEEKYMHGSLLVNALRWAGTGDVGIVMYMRDHIYRKHLARVLRRYLKFQLGIGEAR